MVWNKDAFLRIKRDVGVPTYQLGKAEADVEGEEEEENEEEDVPIVKPRTSRRKTSKPDLKGKGIAFL